MVTSSAYSMSEPAGTPVAMRVMVRVGKLAVGFVGEVAGGGFAFDGGGCGEDELGDGSCEDKYRVLRLRRLTRLRRVGHPD